MTKTPNAHAAIQWTNASVRALAGDEDPVAVVRARARQIVVDALDLGWAGPPFDPLALAEMLGLEVAANSEVPDARIVSLGKLKTRIEFNPNRPRGRMRYSVAHEIAHTMFPDCAEQIRNRARHDELAGDEWQLEALCNIAAAELLMPLGSLNAPASQDLSIHAILDLQRRFDVSTEALVIRLAETSEQPLAAFCASPQDAEHFRGYQLDYMIASRGWGDRLPRRTRLPQDSVVRQCTAIGFSARGVESWWSKRGPAQVEAVGIPPYPGGAAPRVVGLVRPVDARSATRPCLEYVHGNATAPRGEGRRLVVHVVNDKTPKWGGGGFASALRTEWPAVQHDFQDWVEHHTASYRLGSVRVVRVDDRLSVASIIAQHGYGPSAKPRIRYAALRDGLAMVARVAADENATVHMPRIGTGQAGGRWSIVRDLIGETLCASGVQVTVYDLPSSRLSEEPQSSFSFTSDAPSGRAM